MTKSEVKMVWIYMQENWPNFPIPENAHLRTVKEKVWVDLCGHLELALVHATIASLASREFPPTPGLIQQTAAELTARMIGQPVVPDVDEAWLEFRTNYRTRGPWSHPAIAAAADSIGCRAFGNAPEADEMAWRAHFMKIYASSSRRAQTELMPLPPVLEAYMASAVQKAPQMELGPADE